jgi:tetratricopeptide (TPR) repeat protein
MRTYGAISATRSSKCAEDAILCFRRAFEIDPNCWNSAYKAGALLRQQNRLAEALASFDA